MEEKLSLILTLIFGILTCILMILSILLFPEIKITKTFSLGTYWIVVIAGAIIVVGVSGIPLEKIGDTLIEDSEINPLKILALIIALSLLSIYVDELGFFQYLANIILEKSKSNQKKLFFLLYIMVSVLTIFASNDVIVLAFTPFICYFAKNAKISPIPYLTSEFVAANTWSMTLIIGNPTNIYLGAADNIDFVSFLKIMIVPTVLSGVTALGCLYLMNRKTLNEPIKGEPNKNQEIKNKPLLIIGLIHLISCIILLAIGDYINLPMWIVSLAAAGSLYISVLICSAIIKRSPIELWLAIKRAPWELIPFVLGMFIIILCIKHIGITKILGEFLGSDFSILKYGGLGFIMSNLINSIPMSVLFWEVMSVLPNELLPKAIYPTIAASNIGGFFTPIGALAGIMFTGLLKEFDIKYGFLDFIKVGLFVGIPTFIVCLLGIWLMLWSFGI